MRSSRSSPDERRTRTGGGGASERIGLRDICSTTAGGGGSGGNWRRRGDRRRRDRRRRLLGGGSTSGGTGLAPVVLRRRRGRGRRRHAAGQLAGTAGGAGGAGGAGTGFGGSGTAATRRDGLGRHDSRRQPRQREEPRQAAVPPRQAERSTTGHPRRLRRFRRDGRRLVLEQLRGLRNFESPNVDRNVAGVGLAAPRLLGTARMAQRAHIVDVRVVDAGGCPGTLVGGGSGRGRRVRRRIRPAPGRRRAPCAPDLGPHVVAAASGDDREVLARKLRHRRQFVLDGAELVERALGFGRQQLRHDAVDRLERQAAAGQIDLPVGATTYGLSPACMTSASPSTLTIA